MPRFVILEHDHPHQHWDLMLECGDALWTWRLPAWPRSGETIEAERVFDHRLAYLDYEGPISGNRGTVIRREQGMFAWQVQGVHDFVIRIDGVHLSGVLRLTRDEKGGWRVAMANC